MTTPPPPQIEPPRESQDEQLLCPLCDYDLRGQVEPRCPECGYTFDFDELRDPARRLHKYLFEHHPERNVSSFLQTFLAGWRPGKFWRTLYPAQASNLRRLMIYQLVVTAACVAPLLAVVPVFFLDQSWRSYLPSLWAALRLHRPPRQILIVCILLTLWPWLTFAALMIFQATIRRARIKPAHLLRCALYGCDLVAAGALALLAAIACEYYYGDVDWLWYPEGYVLLAARGILFGFPVLVACRLMMACRHYIRIDSAFAVALITQLMLALLATKLALDADIVNFFL